MKIHRPRPNKLLTLNATNPHYWKILVERSQYDENEILEVLVDAEKVNDEWHAFQEDVYTNILGEMNSYASDVLERMAYEGNYVGPNLRYSNYFQVKTWRKNINGLYEHIKKMQKFIKENIDEEAFNNEVRE